MVSVLCGLIWLSIAALWSWHVVLIVGPVLLALALVDAVLEWLGLSSPNY
jgi:hypothetical protein